VWVLTRDEGNSDLRLQRADELDNLRFIQVPIPKKVQPISGLRGLYIRYLAWQRAAYREATQLLSEYPFDIVHHVTWGSLVLGSPLWRLGLPFVFGPVGGGQLTPRGYQRYFGGYWWRELARNGAVRRIVPISPLSRRPVRGAHLVLCINTDTLRLVERMGARRSHLIIDAAVPPSYEGGCEPRSLRTGETLRIVWVGRLLRRKGLLLALQALSRIREIPWHLTIVGDGSLGARVPGWLKEFQIEDRVNWLGQISWGEVKREYQKAHVMLFTSLRDSAGNQLYEASACGLPAIVLNHHGARDMLPDSAAIKADVGNPNETISNLSAAIRDLAANPTRVQEMSRAAVEFSATNTWERKVRETYDLIDKSLRTAG
jgi:glycosyltransferase involved in cell wall biosynthesis